jgi:hypothetical protein
VGGRDGTWFHFTAWWVLFIRPPRWPSFVGFCGLKLLRADEDLPMLHGLC